METINNMATAAANAVWGSNGTTESKQEPISGVNGDTSKGEPYDAGNMDPPKQPKQTQANGSAEPAGPPAQSTPSDTTSGQNDTREPSNPATDVDANKQQVHTEGAGPNDGPELNGPGPKPVATVAKEHGGDAGNNSSESSTDSLPGAGEGEGKDDDDDDSGIQKHSSGTGTGEQYVKSSGLKADGGDFDASAPGAGREADRLLDQKGVKRETPPAAADNVTDGATDDKANEESKTVEKLSLKDKIKAKLHAH